MPDPVAFFNYDTSDQNVAQFLRDQEKEYNVFTGADMTAYIGRHPIGKLQGITCSITRETMPIYTSGDPNPKGFAKGKRGIAGNLVFTQFDKHAILRDLYDASQTSLQNIWQALNNVNVPAGVGIQGVNSVSLNDLVLQSDIGVAQNVAQQDLLQTYYLVAKRRLDYVDMIPAFDITITLVNENGNAATCAVHGVQLINEVWSYTLDDLRSESAFTYVARAVTPLNVVADPANITTNISGMSNTNWN